MSSSQRTRGDSPVTSTMVAVAVFVAPQPAPQLKPNWPRGMGRAAAAFVYTQNDNTSRAQRPLRGLPSLPRTEVRKSPTDLRGEARNIDRGRRLCGITANPSVETQSARKDAPSGSRLHIHTKRKHSLRPVTTLGGVQHALPQGASKADVRPLTKIDKTEHPAASPNLTPPTRRLLYGVD